VEVAVDRRVETLVGWIWNSGLKNDVWEVFKTLFVRILSCYINVKYSFILIHYKTLNFIIQQNVKGLEVNLLETGVITKKASEALREITVISL